MYNKKQEDMKKNSTFKRLMAVAVIAVAGSLQGFAYNNVWVKAEAYPTGAGKVYVTPYNPLQPDDTNPYNPDFQNESEFKRSDQFASTAFLDFQVTEGYQFAGMVRDNGDGAYGEGDEQVRRREEDGNFTAVYDPTEYYDGNSTTSLAAAQEALEQLEKPTDYIFAVFTKGDIGRVTPECSSFYGSDMGKVIGSKLDNAPGEEVTFTAVPDAHYHFVKWTNDKGEDVSTVNPLTVTVEGGRLFLANFAKGDPEGISDIDYSVRNDNRFFDLQGRQVAVPRKGVFVRGGEKVVVK